MTNPQPLTLRQIDLARHALGLPNNEMRSKGNLIVPHTRDYHGAWLEMVDSGMAYIFEAPGLTYFRLTRRGAEAALFPGETLDEKDFPVPTAAKR